MQTDYGDTSMERPVESVGSNVLLATSVGMSWVGDLNFAALMTVGVPVATAAVGLYVKQIRDRGIARADVEKAQAEAKVKIAEAEVKEAEADKAKNDVEFERQKQQLEIEKQRQAMVAGSFAGQMESLQRSLDDALKQLSTANSALTLREQENQALHSMLDQMKREIKKEVSDEQKVLRHNVVDRFSGEFSKLQLDSIEKDAEIAKLRKELEKTKGVVNRNADATEKVAEGANPNEIQVAHIDDTSGDMPTLPG